MTVPVTKTGTRPGKHAVQVYLSRVSGSAVERPALWLAGYAVVRAEPGETVTASATIEPHALQHWSVDDHAWRAEPGTYRAHVGSSVADLASSVDLEV